MKAGKLFVQLLLLVALLVSCNPKEKAVQAAALGDRVEKRLEERGFTVDSNGLLQGNLYDAEGERGSILCQVSYDAGGLRGILVQTDIQGTEIDPLNAFTQAAQEVNGYFHEVQLDASHWAEAVERMKKSGNVPVGEWQGQAGDHIVTFNICHADGEDPNLYTVFIDTQCKNCQGPKDTA